MSLVITIHIIICVLLIVIILIQAGRGGGLVEGFSGVESMFGPKTNTFLTRTTTILSILFFFTCIILAFLSVQQSKSLMRKARNLKRPTQATAGLTNKSIPEQRVAPASQTIPIKSEEAGAPAPGQTETIKPQDEPAAK